jgi:CRP-like cAMP-binding protein
LDTGGGWVVASCTQITTYSQAQRLDALHYFTVEYPMTNEASASENKRDSIHVNRVSIYQGLSPEEIKTIQGLGKTVQFVKGDTVFEEGSKGSNLFVVLEGHLAIHKHDKFIAKCKEGDAFGEMAILNQRPRSATVAALMDVKLFTLDENAISAILESPVAVRFLLNIIHGLSDRLEIGNTWIASSLESRRQ